MDTDINKSNICLLVKETYAIMEWNVKHSYNINTDINKSNICLLVKGTYATVEWNVKILKTGIQI